MSLTVPFSYISTGYEPVKIIPQRRLEPSNGPLEAMYAKMYGTVPGGLYIDRNGKDITGEVRRSGVLRLSSMSGVRVFEVSAEAAELAAAGRLVRFNLIRKSAGWKWVDQKSSWNLVLSELISVETGGKHFYAKSLNCQCPIMLARYLNKTEPRLRPTARGTLSLNDVIGFIELRRVLHPVYETIVIS